MADTPPRGLPPTPAAPFWPPTPPNPPRSSPSWLGGAALTVATAALAVGILGWFRPAPPPPAQEPVFTEQQVEAAKERACAAFDLVKRSLIMQTEEEHSDDTAKIDARAANARLAIASGANYLHLHLDSAAPQDIDSAIRKLSSVMMDLVENYMTGARDSDPEQSVRLEQAESLVRDITELCK